MVGLADAALGPLRLGRRPPARTPRRILLLRLERIGDLLMAMDAIGLVGRLYPDAEVDVAVGSWNEPLARLMPGLTRVHVVDVPWLARERTRWSWRKLVAAARRWRLHGYDVVLNFEPDIRSNFLAWLSGASRRTGYFTGGGGAFLTESWAYDESAHVGVNAERLVRRTFGAGNDVAAPAVRLPIPEDARRHAETLLSGGDRRLVGVHASGGRPSKQWHPERFADAIRQIALERGAAVVLTGAPADRPLVDAVAARLRDVHTIDLCGDVDLPALAAVLERLDLLVTGDTGPMHLAAAVGTPIVALFGPSDPRRYGPRGGPHEVLRVDLPCSPCGLVRMPPVRCRNRVPECLDSIGVDAVVSAARRLASSDRSDER